MSRAIVYHSVDPQNVKSTYTAGGNVDFMLAFPGRSLELGSIRLEGVLSAKINGVQVPTAVDGGPVNASDEIYMDPFVGAHSFVESVQTQMNGSQLETIQDYPRYVKMEVTAKQSQTDMMNSQNVCELKGPDLEASRQCLFGEQLQAQAAQDNQILPDFSIRPMVILNQASGLLPYRKSSDIRLTFNLEEVSKVLFGRDWDSADCTYELSELRVTFKSMMDGGPSSDGPLIFKRTISLKQTFETSVANLNMRVPGICQAFHVSFIPTAEEADSATNCLALHRVRGLSQVQYSYNDSTNALISYRLQDQVEWLGRYLESFQDPRDGSNAAVLTHVYGNDVFGLGLNLGGPIDLSQQKLTIQINSLTNEVTTAFFYFTSIISM